MQVGEWIVDAGLNALQRSDVEVRLEPKVMEVLLYLAAHPGQVVSRDALMAAVWPGVIVGEDALTQAVIKLRKALGDDPKQPSYILTIPKRGYKLLAIVHSDQNLHTQATNPLQSARPSHRRHALLAILILAILTIALWLSHRPESSAVRNSPSTAHEDLRVAVVPFHTLKSTPESSYLASGLSSELVSNLSRLSSLRVISITHGNVPPDARYLVDGIVQQDNGRLRIHVHLTDNVSRQEIWSEQFDRPMHDLLDLQSELSRRLIAELPLKLNEAERRRAAQRYTQNLDAYDLFLRAQSALLARTQNENETARALYQQSIYKDPAFARAYAGLALTYAADYRNQWTNNGKEALGRAFDMAETARQIDPEIPQIYWTLGFVHAQRHEYDEALGLLSKAVRLNPSYADAYALIGGINTYIGKPAETLPQLRTAQRLNPEAGYLYFQLLGRAYFFLNDFDQARLNLSEALSRNAADLESHVYLAATMAKQGNLTSASWEVEEIRSLQPNFQVNLWMSTYPLADNVLRQHLAETLHGLGL